MLSPLILFRIYKLITFYLEYRKLAAQGIPSIRGRFNVIADAIDIVQKVKENPSAIDMSLICRRAMGVVSLPPATIISVFGHSLVLINSAEYLQDIYVNKNSCIDKDYGKGNESEPIIGQGILFASSADPTTHTRRKALSGAFFKSKLIPMTKVIREVSLKVIKKWQQDGSRQVNFVDFAEELQAKVIVTILIGAEHADQEIEYEDKSGKMKKETLTKFLLEILLFTMYRN